MESSDHPLRAVREHLNLSIDSLAEATGVSARTILRAEQGYGLQPGSRRLLCTYLGLSADELGLRPRHGRQLAAPLVSESEALIIAGPTSLPESVVHASLLGQGEVEKLDSAESIINLAWEAWFASRPNVVSRSVAKLLPELEQTAYTPYLLPVQTLRAKELVIRAHGLLGSVCLDALHNDIALFHYMQAHRFAEEIHDSDHAATYLCLVGEVLRRQKDEVTALQYMENARTSASGASKATRGHILQMLAYAYGDIGQEAPFERAIEEATDLLAFAREGRDISQKEFIPFEIYEIRGKINRDLGKPMSAIPYLDLAEASLITADAVTPRWYALLEISRAQAYCDAGEFAAGIDLACKGFLKAYQCHSSYQMNRVRKLLRKLEQGLSRNDSGVQDLKNLLYETYMRMDSEDVR